MNTPSPAGRVVFDETPYAPAGHACRDCAHFSAPTSEREKIEKVGGVWRGDCVLNPTTLKKTPDDRCGQHSALVAALRAAEAEALAAALAPVIERGLAAIASALSGKESKR